MEIKEGSPEVSPRRLNPNRDFLLASEEEGAFYWVVGLDCISTRGDKKL